jgi:hypothetical protein
MPTFCESLMYVKTYSSGFFIEQNAAFPNKSYKFMFLMLKLPDFCYKDGSPKRFKIKFHLTSLSIYHKIKNPQHELI